MRKVEADAGMEQQAKPSPEQVGTRIVDALVEFGADRDQLRPEATLEELDIDSLDLFELSQILHQEFGIEVDPQDFEDVNTVGQAQEAMLSYLK
jgi:acyl carrier protein